MRGSALALALLLSLSGCLGDGDPADEDPEAGNGASVEEPVPPDQVAGPTEEIWFDRGYYPPWEGELTGTVEYRMDGGPWSPKGRFHSDMGVFEADSDDGGLQHLPLDGNHTLEARFLPEEDGNLTGQWSVWGPEGSQSDVLDLDTPFRLEPEGPGAWNLDLWVQDDVGRSLYFSGRLVWTAEWTATGTVAGGGIPGQGPASHRYLVPAGSMGLILETEATSDKTLPAGRTLGLAVFEAFGVYGCRGGQNPALDQDDTDQYMEVERWATGSIEVWVGQLPADCYNTDRPNLESIEYALHVRLEPNQYY